jgi:hypothetical protein
MKRFLSIAIALVFAVGLSAQDETALHKKHYNLENGIAVSGYDVVAYFTQNKAVKGSKDNAVFYTGSTYYFSSTANKEEFKKNPAKYEPAYGGWCSYAMGAKGEKVEIDPKTFKIVNGKLNLFYNKLFNNTLTDWNKDETNLKKKADINWSKIYN